MTDIDKAIAELTAVSRGYACSSSFTTEQMIDWLEELKRYRTARELLHKEQQEYPFGADDTEEEFNYYEGYHDALSNVVRMIEFGEDWDNDD